MSLRRGPELTVSDDGLLEIGLVARPHGIQGEVKVQIAPEYAGALTRIQRVFLEIPDKSKGGFRTLPYRVQAARIHQNALLLKLQDVDTRNDAEALRGAMASVNVAELPELEPGDHYIHELLGLQVDTVDGRRLGELVEVLTTGANDVYVVQDSQDRETLLPAIDSVVLQVDLDAGVMTVAIPEGLL